MTADPHRSETPSPWIVRWSHLVAAGGQVLDVAAGGGRHARHFASRGCRVTAVDRDAAALATLAGVPGVETVVADIEGGPWPLDGRSFDAIVVTNYLHRPLFPVLAAALAPDGVLLYETFMLGNEAFGKPSNPNFLLAAGELLEAFASLTVAGFEQGRVDLPRPAVVQRIAAVRTGRPDGIVLPRNPAGIA